MINTIETRLRLDAIQEIEIDACVSLWSWGYRKAWKLWNNQKLTENEVYYKLKELNSFTTEQISSLISKVKTEHSKLRELTKYQLNQYIVKLENIEKFITKESKIIAKNNKKITELKNENAIKYREIARLNKAIDKKQFVLNRKRIKVNRLKKMVKTNQSRIDKNNFKLCFGSSKLLSQRPGNHTDKFRTTSNQKVYTNVDDWKNDWNLSRNNIIYSVGRSANPQGNPGIQYYPETKKLRFRVIEKEYLNRLKKISLQMTIILDDLIQKEKYSSFRMEARFIEINNVEFSDKNQLKIIKAIASKLPITAKIIKKMSPNGINIGYYLQLSFEENMIDSVILNDRPKTIGIDLNQKGLAYCIVTNDGNKLSNKKMAKYRHRSCGFISWELNGKTTQQRKWIISNAISEVLSIAQEYGVYSVALENLDFSKTVSSMNSGYKLKTTKNNFNYNAMISGFAKTQFKELIVRKAARLGMTINMVNPVYSSVGGYAKYGLINKLPVDIAASLWLARQSIYGQSYKTEDNVKFIKKYNEGIILPYLNLSKQSKREIKNKLEWRDISLALGADRKQWYANIINYINLEVDKSLSLKKLNPF